MAKTYEPIQTYTLASTSTLVTFSSIPSTYTDLRLITQVQSTASVYDLTYRFNSDTATNYSRTVLTGNGTSATSGRSSNATYIRPDIDAYVNSTTWQFVTTDIFNYANTTTFKTTLSRVNGGGTPAVEATVSLWRKTPEAINTIAVQLDVGTGTFAIGSTFTLYGIKAA